MQKTPYIGKLDRKIKLYKEVFTKSSTGEDKPTLELVTGAWALMEEVSGDEDVEGKVRHLIKRKYTIRYNVNILALKNQLKLLDGVVYYNVFHLKEIGRKRYLELLVNEYE
jgi:head-tail adaptor